MNFLKDKNIIVTGASGGIGNSIIKRLNDNNANILASGTKIEKLEKIKNDFDNIKILKFDISEVEKIESFIEDASKILGGKLDCIINNAGITRDNNGQSWAVSAIVNHSSAGISGKALDLVLQDVYRRGPTDIASHAP